MYAVGAITSATCGFIGMMIATYSNGRTAAAAEQGLDKALRVSFNSGSVMVCTHSYPLPRLRMRIDIDLLAACLLSRDLCYLHRV